MPLLIACYVEPRLFFWCTDLVSACANFLRRLPASSYAVSGAIVRTAGPLLLEVRTTSGQMILTLAGLELDPPLHTGTKAYSEWKTRAEGTIAESKLSRVECRLWQAQPGEYPNALVYCDGENLNALLVRAGLARTRRELLLGLPLGAQHQLLSAQRHRNAITTPTGERMSRLWRAAVGFSFLIVGVAWLERYRWFSSRTLNSAEFGYTELQNRRTKNAFARQLIISQEQERKRVARELHDTVGQDLLLIKNAAALALQSQESAKLLVEKLSEISTLASKTIDQIREISYALRPAELDRLGLSQAITAMVDANGSSGVEFDLECGSIDHLLSPEFEISLYRLLQEGINNILKHANASNASIRVKANHHTLTAILADNGRGIDLQDFERRCFEKKHFGLSGIKERVAIMHGRFKIKARPGKGTALIIQIPIRHETEDSYRR